MNDYLTYASRRVHSLECQLRSWRKVLRDFPEQPVFADLKAIEREGGDISVEWFGPADRAYEVQESTDGLNWFVTARGVAGNLWLSGNVYGSNATPYFRIVMLPTNVVCCSLPHDNEEPTPRFFEKLIGPTGGGIYGGCSDCEGDFPYCNDELALLS